MKPEDIEKLLGGYATGTLTPDEQKSLFEAALGHQELFNSLADEEALRELLADPAFRARLKLMLAPQPNFWARLTGALLRPVPMAAAAALASGAVAVVIFMQPRAEMEKTQELAFVKQPATIQDRLEAAAPPPPPAAADVKMARKNVTGSPATSEPSSKPDDKRELSVAAPAPAAAAASNVLQETILAEREQASPLRAAKASADAPAGPPAEEKRVRAMTTSVEVRDEAFRQAASKVAAPLRYRLERRGQNESYAAVGDSSTLRAGDSVRLIVEPATSGWLHVMVRQGAGTRTLFHGEVESGSSYTVPQAGALPSEAGERTLMLAFSRGPMGAGQVALGFVSQRADEGAGARQKEQDKDKSAAAAPPAVQSAVGADVPVTIEIPLRFQ